MPLEELPRPVLAADCAVVAGPSDRARILLIRRGGDPYAGSWALPGGFVEERERTEDAARRELEEETGVRAGRLELLGVYDDPRRDPRGWVVSVIYLARIDLPVAASGADDAADARWFELDAPPAELAFDHVTVLADLRRRLS